MRRKRARPPPSPAPPSPPAPPPLPPSPPRPPPYCELAPPASRVERYSETEVEFPASQAHYEKHLVPGRILNATTGQQESPSYDGTVSEYCNVTVRAVYTCAADDAQCNANPAYMLSVCGWQCNDGRQCNQTAAGHPLVDRVCDQIYMRVRPNCTALEPQEGLPRQAAVTYIIDVCPYVLRPPPPPLPRPPAPPLGPPPPPPPPLYEYYYVYYEDGQGPPK